MSGSSISAGRNAQRVGTRARSTLAVVLTVCVVVALVPAKTAAQMAAHTVPAAPAHIPQLAAEASPLTTSQRLLATVYMLSDGLTTGVRGVRVRPSIGRRGPAASVSWTASRVTGVTAESELATTLRIGLAITDGRRLVWSLRMNLSLRSMSGSAQQTRVPEWHSSGAALNGGAVAARSQGRATLSSATGRSFA
jgi:hypothetical protein